MAICRNWLRARRTPGQFGHRWWSVATGLWRRAAQRRKRLRGALVPVACHE
jgi:hypothetical protein